MAPQPDAISKFIKALWHDADGPIYTATFSAVGVSAAQDAFEIVTDSTHWARIRGVYLGQYSDFGDAAAEIISVLFIRDYTVSGSSGSAVTPRALRSWTAAATSTVEANNTTVANTGTPLTLWAEAWNVQAPYIYYPPRAEQIVLGPSERLVIRLTAPADSLTTNGTLVFEELTARPSV